VNLNNLNAPVLSVLIFWRCVIYINRHDRTKKINKQTSPELAAWYSFS